MNETNTLDAFAEPITALPTQPSLPPEELKRRLQAPADEVRLAHNALASSHERLDDRVSCIIAQTFGDSIDKSMLSTELKREIDNKAAQTDLANEITARQAIDAAVAQKCEAYFGQYTGDGAASQFIDLGFTPQAVLVFNAEGKTCTGFNYYNYTGGLALPGAPVIGAGNIVALEVTEGGFTVHNQTYGSSNSMTVNSGAHYFIAFR